MNWVTAGLTAVPCKIMESIIRDKMLKFAHKNNFMTSNQHGFIESRSCLTNVLETLEDLIKTLDSVQFIYFFYYKNYFARDKFALKQLYNNKQMLSIKNYSRHIYEIHCKLSFQ